MRDNIFITSIILFLLIIGFTLFILIKHRKNKKLLKELIIGNLILIVFSLIIAFLFETTWIVHFSLVFTLTSIFTGLFATYTYFRHKLRNKPFLIISGGGALVSIFLLLVLIYVSYKIDQKHQDILNKWHNETQHSYDSYDYNNKADNSYEDNNYYNNQETKCRNNPSSCLEVIITEYRKNVLGEIIISGYIKNTTQNVGISGVRIEFYVNSFKGETYKYTKWINQRVHPHYYPSFEVRFYAPVKRKHIRNIVAKVKEIDEVYLLGGKAY